MNKPMTSAEVMAETVAERIANDMRDWIGEEDIPPWDECRCTREGGGLYLGHGRLHRRYTGSCVGHEADECPWGGIHSSPTRDDPGGWEHNPDCRAEFARVPEMDSLKGAAWRDLLDGSIAWHDPWFDPATCIFRKRAG